MQLGAANPIGAVTSSDFNFTSLESDVKTIKDQQKYILYLLIFLVVLTLLNKA
jgi:hypothetical protein